MGSCCGIVVIFSQAPSSLWLVPSGYGFSSSTSILYTSFFYGCTGHYLLSIVFSTLLFLAVLETQLKVLFDHWLQPLVW